MITLLAKGYGRERKIQPGRRQFHDGIEELERVGFGLDVCDVSIKNLKICFSSTHRSAMFSDYVLSRVNGEDLERRFKARDGIIHDDDGKRTS